MQLTRSSFPTQEKVFVILGYESSNDGMEECYKNVKSEADERIRNKCARPRLPHAESEGDSRQSKRMRPSTSEF